MEEILAAIQSIVSHKMRSVLTMLGVIIGIAAIIAIFSIIEGNTANMKQEMIGGSNNTTEIEYDKKSSFDRSLRTSKEENKPNYFPLIGKKQLNEILEIPGAINAGLAFQTDTHIYHKSKNAQGKVSAVTENMEELRQLTPFEGEGFDTKDFEEDRQVIFLNKALYQELFDDKNAINEYVEVNGVPFKVKGILESKDTSSIGYSFNENEAYVPLGAAYKLFNEIDIIPKVTIQSTNTDSLQHVAEKAADVLNQGLPQSDYRYGVRNMEEFRKSIEQLNQANFILLAGIASISLLVGGIGVMNIMLVSVTERTREIGIKKALGARRKVILKQFLVEAVVITLLGGILGAFIGLFSGFLITNILQYPYIVSIVSIISSLTFCCIIGIIFGLLPAMKASKLDPIEALRFE